MLTRLRFVSAGESHGPRLTAILEGLPAGFALDPAAIDAELARRQRGFGAGGRMKIERDRVALSGGWMAGRTTGGPLALTVENRDWKNWAEREIPPMTAPRPGHADLVGAVKYGYRELRLALERASARETAMRVAAGAACKQILAELGVEVGGYTLRIGDAAWVSSETDAAGYRARFAAAQADDVACPDGAAADAMRATIAATRKAKDTLGGVIEVVALGLPVGLGSYVHWERRLDARLGAALLSVPAMKGVEIGPAFANAALPGTRVHDAIERTGDGALTRPTNRAGGLEAGVTNGQPLILRVAKKPIATTLDPRPTVDLASGEATTTTYERSDFCAVPRAVPILESVVALVLLDALLEKLGGDGRDELLARLATLRQARVEDLAQDGAPWRFGPLGSPTEPS